MRNVFGTVSKVSDPLTAVHWYFVKLYSLHLLSTLYTTVEDFSFCREDDEGGFFMVPTAGHFFFNFLQALVTLFVMEELNSSGDGTDRMVSDHTCGRMNHLLYFHHSSDDRTNIKG